MEEQRKQFLGDGEEAQLSSLCESATRHRNDCRLRANSPILDDRQKAEAKEIAEWLGVWLRTPELFVDWLDLRRASQDFRARFGGS